MNNEDYNDIKNELMNTEFNIEKYHIFDFVVSCKNKLFDNDKLLFLDNLFKKYNYARQRYTFFKDKIKIVYKKIKNKNL